MLLDLRHAARGLLRAPGFTAVAILTLALGIGATAAMFTVVNRVVLNPLPFPNVLQLSLFAAMALTLAMVGVYGLLSYTVVQRTPELGIRLALGGPPAAIRGLILRQGMRLVLAGVLIGLPAALLLARTLRSLLFGIGAHDLVTLIGAVTTLLVVSAAASYLPARRATRVDPMTALRNE